MGVGVVKEGLELGGETEMSGRGLDHPLVVGVVLLTGFHWVSLALQLPLWQSMPGWFLGYSVEPLGASWPIAVVLGAMGLAAWVVFREAVSVTTTLVLLVVFGFVIQVGVAALEGRGLGALRDPLTKIGNHSELMDVSLAEPSMVDVVRNYDDYAATGRLKSYAQSKPPGFLLFYMATERATTFLGGPGTPEELRARTANVASLVWSVLSFLVLLPLFWFSRLYLDARSSAVVCLLYLVIPSVQMFSGHLDQVLFPLITMGVLSLSTHALRRSSEGLAAAAGSLCALAAFISFSLLPVIPLVGVVLLAEALRPERADEGWTPVMRAGLAMVAGAAVVQVLLYFSFDYNPIERFGLAMSYHANWKMLPFDTRTVVYTSALNMIEYATWLGVPLASAWAFTNLNALSRLLRREEQAVDRIALGLVGVILLMCIFGRTMAEVARLWLFLTPLLCFLVVATITKHFRHTTVLFATTVGLQGVTVLLFKRFSDL